MGLSLALAVSQLLRSLAEPLEVEASQPMAGGAAPRFGEQEMDFVFG